MLCTFARYMGNVADTALHVFVTGRLVAAMRCKKASSVSAETGVAHTSHVYGAAPFNAQTHLPAASTYTTRPSLWRPVRPMRWTWGGRGGIMVTHMHMCIMVTHVHVFSIAKGLLQPA